MHRGTKHEVCMLQQVAQGCHVAEVVGSVRRDRETRLVNFMQTLLK